MADTFLIAVERVAEEEKYRQIRFQSLCETLGDLGCTPESAQHIAEVLECVTTGSVPVEALSPAQDWLATMLWNMRG